MYIVLLWASLWTKVDLKSAVTSLLRTRASANSASSGKSCNVCTLSAFFFCFHCFKGKLKRVKARHKRRKLRKRYSFCNSCAWQKKGRPLSSLSVTSKENHFPVLCRASPSHPGPCCLEVRGGLIPQRADAALQRDGHQPDMWLSPAGIPLATCLWPSARLVLFFLRFSFLLRRDFSVCEGFSKESQLGAGISASVQRQGRKKEKSASKETI